MLPFHQFFCCLFHQSAKCSFGQNIPKVTLICCDLVGSVYPNCTVNVLSNSLVNTLIAFVGRIYQKVLELMCCCVDLFSARINNHGQ